MSEEVLKMLENEFKDQEFVNEFDETFLKWIKVKGLRLSTEEKETIAFYGANFDLDLNDENKVRELVLDHRKDKEELKKQLKEEEKFNKELSRLAGEDLGNYCNEVGFYNYELIYDGINYMGAKEYARYWYNTRF